MPTVNVREARIQRGWTLRGLAEMCAAAGAPTTGATIYRIEALGQTPKPPLRGVLVELLNLDAAELGWEAPKGAGRYDPKLRQWVAV